MPHGDNDNQQPPVLDSGDYAVVFEAPAPVAGVVAHHGFAPTAGIIQCSNQLKASDYASGMGLNQFAQLLARRRIEFKRPGQVRASSVPA